MKDLWENGTSRFKGEHFTMEDCKMAPAPKGKVEIVAAGQSGTGMKFAADHADYDFILGTGVNTPMACADSCANLVKAVAELGRDVGASVLFMIIADETDAVAEAKWQM